MGRHLMLELKDCNREVLNNLELLREALFEAAQESGATVLGESFHCFQPQGVSGVVVIAESHFFLHTWPEHGYAAVDIFTCGNRVRPEAAARLLIERLEARNHSVIEIKRGVLA